MDFKTKEEKIESKEEKIKFLESILKIAKENPAIITNKGRGVFYNDYPAFDEACTIGIHLDEEGKPYFIISGSYLNKPSNQDKIYGSESLLHIGKRYFEESLEKFKKDFHLFETREGGLDLLDKIK